MGNVQKDGDVIKNILSLIKKPEEKKSGAKPAKLTADLSALKAYQIPPSLSMMKAISSLASHLGKQKKQQAVARDAALPEDDLDGTDLALSQAILRKDWNDDKRLEPQLVLDYIESIYDTDDIFLPIRRNIQGTVLIVITPSTEGDLTLKKFHPLSAVNLDIEGVNFTIDPAFPYIDQPSAAVYTPRIYYATGFMIGKNLFATAGHVARDIKRSITESAGSQKVAIYTFRYIKDTDIRFEKISDDIKVLDYRQDSTDDSFGDWGLLKAELQIDHRITPLEIDLKGFCGQEVYCLGHGLGLPLKMSWYGMVFQKNNNRFTCKLETFGGNSGSPVFDAVSHKVVGIVSGATASPGELVQTSPNTLIPAVYLEGYDGAVCTTMMPIAEWTLAHIYSNGI